MSKTKASGSTKLGRDSISKRLGVKAYAGEKVKIGNILVRQRGTRIIPGKNTKKGCDDTIFSKVDGVVVYQTKNKILFSGARRKTKVVSVLPDAK